MSNVLMSRLGLRIVIASLSAGLVFDITAQEKPTKSTLTDLGIEVVDRDYVIPFRVPRNEGGYLQIRAPAALPDWRQSENSVPLTDIRIRSVAEEDGVRLKIGAIFDDSEPVDAPGPKYGEKEEIIASYFARLGDTVTVRELERFGFKALVLRIGRYEPNPVKEIVPAPTILHEVVNELKSVAFVDLQVEPPANHSYRLTIQNLSSSSIVALTFHIPTSCTETIERTRANPLAMPGAILQTSIKIDDAPQNARSKLVIKSALFDDGNFDGDVEAAAEMAARLRGREVQLSRLLLLLQGISIQQNQEADNLIPEIRSVEKFRIDVDASSVEALQSQFPTLPKAKGKAWLTSKVMDGLKSGRGHALYLLNEIEKERMRDPKRFDLHRSLTALTERIAKLVSNQ